jgi:hypothetical protein
MKADMLEDGTLVIIAENGAEAFALRQWKEKSHFPVNDMDRMLSEHINPFYISLQVAEGVKK